MSGPQTTNLVEINTLWCVLKCWTVTKLWQILWSQT